MTTQRYRSVIVRVDSLKHWEKNPRIITEEHVERLVSMMRSHQGLEPLIVEEDGTVLGGNARLIALKKMGEVEAWAIVVQPKDDQERVEIALEDNDHVGETNKEKLIPLISELPHDVIARYSLPVGSGVKLSDVIVKFSPEPEDGMEDAGIQKVTIKLSSEQYDKFLEGIAVVMEKQGIDGNHSIAVVNLLNEYAGNN